MCAGSCEGQCGLASRVRHGVKRAAPLMLWRGLFGQMHGWHRARLTG